MRTRRCRRMTTTSLPAKAVVKIERRQKPTPTTIARGSLATIAAGSFQPPNVTLTDPATLEPPPTTHKRTLPDSLGIPFLSNPSLTIVLPEPIFSSFSYSFFALSLIIIINSLSLTLNINLIIKNKHGTRSDTSTLADTKSLWVHIERQRSFPKTWMALKTL